jgi:hypothetical protein
MTDKRKHRGTETTEVKEEVLDMSPVGRPKTGKKPKTKNIKIDDETHQALGEIGRLTEDYGDVVARLLKFYREHGGA